MKLFRVPLILLCLALPAQTPDTDAPRRASDAWNEFANSGNDWIIHHNNLIWSKADHDRLEKARAAWKRFDRLAREAQF